MKLSSVQQKAPDFLDSGTRLNQAAVVDAACGLARDFFETVAPLVAETRFLGVGFFLWGGVRLWRDGKDFCREGFKNRHISNITGDISMMISSVAPVMIQTAKHMNSRSLPPQFITAALALLLAAAVFSSIQLVFQGCQLSSMKESINALDKGLKNIALQNNLKKANLEFARLNQQNNTIELATECVKNDHLTKVLGPSQTVTKHTHKVTIHTIDLADFGLKAKDVPMKKVDGEDEIDVDALLALLKEKYALKQKMVALNAADLTALMSMIALIWLNTDGIEYGNGFTLDSQMIAARCIFLSTALARLYLLKRDKECNELRDLEEKLRLISDVEKVKVLTQTRPLPRFRWQDHICTSVNLSVDSAKNITLDFADFNCKLTTANPSAEEITTLLDAEIRDRKGHDIINNIIRSLPTNFRLIS
jgi:hypothetical protein